MNELISLRCLTWPVVRATEAAAQATSGCQS
jgi:hypothetical protein